MDISAYSVRKISATAKHGGTSHWVDVTVYENMGHWAEPKESAIALFFSNGALADAYAAAINGVDPDQPDTRPAKPLTEVSDEEEIAF